MDQQRQTTASEQANTSNSASEQLSSHDSTTSKRVSDHLANERTFLAWVRTGVAIMAFGFVIERFGLLLRELGLKVGLASNNSLHYSKWLGIIVAVLGIVMLIVALFNFTHVRRTIDEERYKPGLLFPIALTCIATLIGLLLAIYLSLTT